MSFRLAASVSAAVVAFGLTEPAARAQTVPPPPPGAAAGPAPQGDPPALVGQIAALAGTVSFHGAGVTTWSAATLNYPVSSGDGLWTEPGAGATVAVGASEIMLSDSTEFEVDTLDPKTLTASEAQGELFVNLALLQPGQNFVIRTPRGTVTMSQPGQYDIAAGDTDHPTLVGVVEGAADIAGTGVLLHVPAGQAASLTGTATFQGSMAALSRDAFLTEALTRVPPPPNGAMTGPAMPAVVSEMTGCSVLSTAGTWQQAPQYGTVWYPHVAAGWRPYRDGRWAWVAPWGWTWVDAQPWGFAPFHYGRWVQINDAWAWAPEPYGAQVAAYPVYAPALVTFFGLGVAVGAAAGFGAFHDVGWVPLGPGEPYRPWYRHSEGYLRGVNVHDVTNTADIGRDPGEIGTLRNRDAATVVGSAALERSERVGQAARGLAAGQLAEAHPFHDAFVRPASLETGPARPGPSIERERAGGVTLRAPGPGIGERAPGAMPALRAPQPARGGEPGRPGEVARPEGALPRVYGPEANRPEANRPEANRPEANRPEANRAEANRPEANRPEVNRAEPGRPGEAARPEASRAEPAHAAQAARPEASQAAPARQEPTHAQARPMPRVETPHAAMARPEARAPVRQVAAPPHVMARPAARPAQHVEARRTAPAPHGGGGGHEAHRG
jgi:hypothetical protein